MSEEKNYEKKHFPDGNYYGELENEKKNGFGTMTYLSGNLYKGYWHNGKRNGQGKMTYSNGDIYEGEWKDNKRHGNGSMLCVDGNNYIGIWINDKFQQDDKDKDNNRNRNETADINKNSDNANTSKNQVYYNNPVVSEQDSKNNINNKTNRRIIPVAIVWSMFLIFIGIGIGYFYINHGENKKAEQPKKASISNTLAASASQKSVSRQSSKTSNNSAKANTRVQSEEKNKEKEEKNNENSDELNSVNAGDYIQFGSYYNEPIMWKVIDKNKNGIMILSDKLLSLKTFDGADENYKNGSNRWSNSNMREWLNSSDSSVEYSTHPPTKDACWGGFNCYDTEAGFLSSFTSTEIESIVPVTVKTPIANAYGGGVDTTTDKVFLLSEDEWTKYVENDISKGKAFPTASAVSNSTYKHETIDSQKYWFYWLRTPDTSTADVLKHVNSDGTIGVQNSTAFGGGCGIRPVVYLGDTCKISDGDGSFSNPYVIE